MIIVLGNLSPQEAITLDIAPGFPPDVKGRFTVDISTYGLEYNCLNFHIYEDEIPLLASVTKDVFHIRCQVYRHNSFSSGPVVYYDKTFRVDQLILLSMASKLLKKI